MTSSIPSKLVFWIRPRSRSRPRVIMTTHSHTHLILSESTWLGISSLKSSNRSSYLFSMCSESVTLLWLWNSRTAWNFVEHILEIMTNSWASSLCTIDSVDSFLNVKLGNVEVVNKKKYPHLVESNKWYWSSRFPCPTVSFEDPWFGIFIYQNWM